MPTGGRGVWKRKNRVDEVRSIDILDLHRKGVFSKGSAWNWTYSWSRNGAVVASISYRVETGENDQSGLRIMYTITDNDTGDKKDYNYIIPAVTTPCNYGGERWWFICPLIVNGRCCQRRCRILYMPTGATYFGCRECHRLTYESRQRHREPLFEGFEKPYRMAQKANEMLARTKSQKNKERAWRELTRAHAALESCKRIINSKWPEIAPEEM